MPHLQPTPAVDLTALARQLASRSVGAEANVQAHIQTILLYGGLNLGEGDLDTVELEAQAGGGRRIDIEVGLTVIEVKRDLRTGNVREKAEEQLADYVRARSDQLGQAYSGVLTDGAEWILYHLSGDALEEVSRLELTPSNASGEALAVWLEGALATAEAIPPTPREVERRLGASSSGYALDHAELQRLYAQNRDVPTVQLKRELWARLLLTALGTSFEDDERLFIDHTLLVVSAEIIAHAVVGIDPTTLSPASLLNGQRFVQAGISGVVDEDFFGWVIEVPGGEQFVRAMARRLKRFAWDDVQHDVMKVLYESIITADWRHRLGEYYTPDWLAERMVVDTVDRPLEQRVLDPSCGSGTFLFQAVRRYLEAAEAEGMSDGDALVGATCHVLGIDVHPVAITLARLTYLLAIGRERLQAQGRPDFHVPVYLGDSLQWRRPETNLWTREGLTISVDESGQLWTNDLHFPSRLLADAGQFDRLVEELADLAARRSPGAPIPSLNAAFRRFGIHPDDQATVEQTFATMCRLHDDGRDHVWSYFVRNLARPTWLCREENRVDCLVGNPPWLAYRFMTSSMQIAFRQLSDERGLWAGASVATHQDLSGLFLARAVELYLKNGGRFSFVMPLAALSRRQFAGFRKGEYVTSDAITKVVFDTPWDLHGVKPNLFRVPPCVVHGRRSDESKELPNLAERWTGRLPGRNIPWDMAAPFIERVQTGVPVAGHGSASTYHTRFTQGATLVPRLLIMVEDAPSSPIGVAAGKRAIRSMRTANEKLPWKNLPGLQGAVEQEFVRPIHLGATLLPFRLLTPWHGVVPWNGTKLLSSAEADIDLYPGLAEWWRTAEAVWDEHNGVGRLTLLERLDYRHGLSVQFPAAPHRVLYTGSGQYMAAARLDDQRAVVDTKLYWAAVGTVEEARYLTAILNSPEVTRRLSPMQSRGEHNPRDFHTLVWRLPIPAYSAQDSRHVDLASLAERAESIIAQMTLDHGRSFQALRRAVREELERSGLALELDVAVAELLGPEA